ncbi:MAG TPA: hypothetical protein VH912_03260 [Streptosporangiaceae bacterium]
MKHSLLHSPTLAACGLALLAGCGTATVDSAAGAGPLRAAPVEAALATESFGWVLTGNQLLLTDDAGASFRDAGLKLPTQARTAFFADADHGWAAALAGPRSVAVARTADGGRNWQTSTVPTKTEVGGLHLSFGDANRGLLLARTRTSSNFSAAEIFATENGGATWRARPATVAGEITLARDGRAWLTGGAAGDELYSSDDQGRHWTRARLSFAAPVDSAAVAPPAAGLLPVTVVRGGRSQLALLSTADGARNWREVKSVPVREPTGPGARVPAAATTAGPVVVDALGGTLLRTAGGADEKAPATVATSHAAGLPAGVVTVDFAGQRAGWALASDGSCRSGKTDCTRTTTVVATRDGGATWRMLLRWQARVG